MSYDGVEHGLAVVNTAVLHEQSPIDSLPIARICAVWVPILMFVEDEGDCPMCQSIRPNSATLSGPTEDGFEAPASIVEYTAQSSSRSKKAGYI